MEKENLELKKQSWEVEMERESLNDSFVEEGNIAVYISKPRGLLNTDKTDIELIKTTDGTQV